MVWYSIGNSAVRALIHGARRGKQQGIGSVTYEKRGTYNKALSEFYAVNPTGVEKKITSRSRRVRIHTSCLHVNVMILYSCKKANRPMK